MIILDTNVLSALMHTRTETIVLDWLDAQVPEELMLTTITMAEILHGIARLPDGKRKSALRDAAKAVLEEEFAGRILAFDEQAAKHYAELVSAREQAGRRAAQSVWQMLK